MPQNNDQYDMTAHPHKPKSINEELNETSEKILEYILKGDIHEANKLIKYLTELTTAYEKVESDNFGVAKNGDDVHWLELMNYAKHTSYCVTSKIAHFLDHMPKILSSAQLTATHITKNALDDLHKDIKLVHDIIEHVHDLHSPLHSPETPVNSHSHAE